MFITEPYKPDIPNATLFRKKDTPWYDDPNHIYGFSLLGQLANIVENVMNPHCASNVISLFCHAAFKECRQVDGKGWVPSLLCRSECESHQEVWRECLSALGTDAETKGNFDDAMLELVPQFPVHVWSAFFDTQL